MTRKLSCITFDNPNPNAIRDIIISTNVPISDGGATVKYRISGSSDNWITAIKNPNTTYSTGRFSPQHTYEISFEATNFYPTSITQFVGGIGNPAGISVGMEPLWLDAGIQVHGRYYDTSGIVTGNASINTGITIEWKYDTDTSWTTLSTSGYGILPAVKNLATINLRYSKPTYTAQIQTIPLERSLLTEGCFPGAKDISGNTIYGICSPGLEKIPTKGSITLLASGWNDINVNVNGFDKGRLMNAMILQDLPFATYTVVLTQLGYVTQTNSYVVSLDNLNASYTISLAVGTYTEVLTTSPIGATIEYKSQGGTYVQKGTTTSSGLTITVPGNVVTFWIRYSKTGYITVEKSYNALAIALWGTPIPIVTLNPDATKTQVFFDSSPSGVTISKDGTAIGTTPCNLIETTGAAVTYSYQKANYTTQSQQHTFNNALAASGVFITMAPITVTKTISTSPPGAKVEQYNGMTYTTLGTTPLYNFTGIVDSNVTFRYSLSGYSNLEKTYKLTSGLIIRETLVAIVPTTSNLKFMGMTGVPLTVQGMYGNTNYGTILAIGDTIKNFSSAYSGPLIVELAVTVGGNAIREIPGTELPVLTQSIAWIPPYGTAAIGPFNVKMISAGLCTARMRIKSGTTGDNTLTEIVQWDVYAPTHQNLVIQSVAFDKSSYTQGNTAILTVTIANTGDANSNGGEILSLVLNGTSMSGSDMVLPPIPFTGGVGNPATLTYNISTGNLFPGELYACVSINNGTPSCASSTLTAVANPATFSFTINTNPTGARIIYYDDYTTPSNPHWVQMPGSSTPQVITRPWSFMGQTEYFGASLNGYVSASIPMVYDNTTPNSTVSRTLVPMGTTPYAPVLSATVTVSNPNPKVGDSVTIQGTLTNTGGTQGSSTVWATIGGAHVGTPQTVNVAAAVGGVTASSPVSITFTVPNTVSSPNQYEACLSLA